MSKENAERPRRQRLPQTKPPMDDEDLFLSPTPRRRANGGRSLTSRRKSRPRSNTFAAPSSSSTPTAEPSGSKAKRGSSRERGGGGAKTIKEESGKQSLGIKMEEKEDLLWRKQNENQGEEDEGTKTTTRMERGGVPEGTLANKSVGRTNVIIICCLALLMASAFVVLKQKSTEKGPYACPIPDAQWVDLLEELLLASSAHNDNSKDNLQELIDVMHRESMKDGFTSFSSSSGKPLSLLFSSSDTPFMWHVVHQIAKARFPSSSSSFSSPSSAHQQQQQQEKEARKEEGEGFVLLDQATREEMSQRVMQVLQQCPYALFVIDVDNYSNKEDPRVIEFLGALFDDSLPTIMQDEKQNGWNNHEKMHDASRSIFVLLSRFGQQKLQGEAKEDAKMVVRKAMKGQWADRFIHRISQVLIF